MHAPVHLLRVVVQKVIRSVLRKKRCALRAFCVLQHGGRVAVVGKVGKVLVLFDFGQGRSADDILQAALDSSVLARQILPCPDGHRIPQVQLLVRVLSERVSPNRVFEIIVRERARYPRSADRLRARCRSWRAGHFGLDRRDLEVLPASAPRVDVIVIECARHGDKEQRERDLHDRLRLPLNTWRMPCASSRVHRTLEYRWEGKSRESFRSKVRPLHHRPTMRKCEEKLDLVREVRELGSRFRRCSFLFTVTFGKCQHGMTIPPIAWLGVTLSPISSEPWILGCGLARVQFHSWSTFFTNVQLHREVRHQTPAESSGQDRSLSFWHRWSCLEWLSEFTGRRELSQSSRRADDGAFETGDVSVCDRSRVEGQTRQSVLLHRDDEEVATVHAFRTWTGLSRCLTSLDHDLRRRPLLSPASAFPQRRRCRPLVSHWFPTFTIGEEHAAPVIFHFFLRWIIPSRWNRRIFYGRETPARFVSAIRDPWGKGGKLIARSIVVLAKQNNWSDGKYGTWFGGTSSGSKLDRYISLWWIRDNVKLIDFDAIKYPLKRLFTSTKFDTPRFRDPIFLPDGFAQSIPAFEGKNWAIKRTFAGNRRVENDV